MLISNLRVHPLSDHISALRLHFLNPHYCLLKGLLVLVHLKEPGVEHLRLLLN